VGAAAHRRCVVARKWTQALMSAASAHCAISSGHRSMRAFQMRRALSKCIATPDQRSARGDLADLPIGDRIIGTSLHYWGDQTTARRSPILTRWRECCALTESSGSQVTPRRREMDSNL
jgi:hypothetical protein